MYLPVITGFMGRKAELERLKKGFLSKHILIIEGIAGSGKTCFVAHFIEQIEGNWGIFFKECRQDLTFSSLLVELNEYLKEEGEMGFELILHETKIDHTGKMRHLVDIMDRRGHVLILDDFHNIKDDGIWDFILFLDRFLKKSKLILISRTSPSITKRLDPNNMEEIILGGFEEEEAISYLKRSIDKEEGILKEIFKKTGGLPLALNLFIGLLRYYKVEDLLYRPSNYAKKVFNRYLINKVFEMLDKDENQLITRFSVFRSPVRKDAISAIYPMANWEEVVFSLIDKLLLIRTGEDLFSMQPLIREFAYEELEEKRKYHIVAARYYLLMKGNRIENGLEAYHHYLQAKEFEGMRDVVILIGDELIRRGDIELAHRLIREVLSKDRTRAGELHLLLGKVLQVWGKLDEGLIEYEMAHKEISDPQKRALVKSQIGGVYLFKEEYDKAKPFLEESLHLRRGTREKGGLAEGLHQMGVLYIGLKRYEMAKEYLLEALEMTKDIGDRSAMAETLNELARIDFYEKEYDEAISKLTKALTFSIETSNKKTQATILHNLGSIYLEKGEYEEAEKNFDSSLKVKEEIGDRFGIAHTYHQLGNLCMDKKNPKGAKGYFQKSKAIFDELRSKDAKYPQYFLDRIDDQ